MSNSKALYFTIRVSYLEQLGPLSDAKEGVRVEEGEVVRQVSAMISHLAVQQKQHSMKQVVTQRRQWVQQTSSCYQIKQLN